jgi:peroxiredoxin
LNALLAAISLLLVGCSPRNPLVTEPAEPTPVPDAENGWPGMLAGYEGYEGDGASEGDLLYDFELLDQNGNVVRLAQMLGSVLVVDASTRWCGPCNEAASTSMDLLARMQDLGPAWIVTLLVQNINGLPATVDDAQEWAEMYGIEYPVVVDDNGQTAARWGVLSYPVFFWVAPTGEIYHRSDAHLPDDESLDLVREGLEEWANELRPTD